MPGRDDYSRHGNVLLQKMTIVEQSEKEKRQTTRVLERERYTPEAIQRVFLQQPVVLRQSALADQLSDDDEGGGDGVNNNNKSRSLLQQIQFEFQETVHDLQTAAKGVMNGLSDLNPLDERGSLRESVRICADALVAVKLHAAVKIQHLQLQVISLQQELAEASGMLSKLTVENDTLRRQIDELQKEEPQQGGGVHTFRSVDLTAETHLNSLLLSRNQAIQENTNLKKMLLHTCPSCRERLPLRKAQRSMSISGSSIHSAEPKSPQRPTNTDSSAIQSSSSVPLPSKHQSHQFAEKQISRPTWQATARSVLHRLQAEAPSDSNTEKVEPFREKWRDNIPTKSPASHLVASKPDRNTPETAKALRNETVETSGSDPPFVRTPSGLASQFKSHMRATADSLSNKGRPVRTASTETIPRDSAAKPRSRPPSRSSSGDSGRFRTIPPPPPSLVESSLNELTSFLFPATTPKRPKGTL